MSHTIITPKPPNKLNSTSIQHNNTAVPNITSKHK